MRRILVIDDDAAVRATICDMLEEAGYTVAEAAHGEDGLARLRAEPAELVVTDILMPEKEGIETIKEVRQLLPDMKIVAISGGGATNNLTFLQLAKQLGADSTLAKPIQFNELVQTVRSLLPAEPAAGNGMAAGAEQRSKSGQA